MKYLILLLLLSLLSFQAEAKGGKRIQRPVGSSLAIADEDKNKDRLEVIYESDFYAYQQTNYAAPSITYSTHGWDLGISSQNIVLSAQVPSGVPTAQNFQNDTYININKTIKYKDILKDISPEWSKKLSFLSTTFGTQNGMVIPMSQSMDPGNLNSKTLHQFYFVDTEVELIKNRLSVHGGTYWANKGLTTTTSYSGYLMGLEGIIIPKTLRANVDFYSGHSNVSGTVFQGTYMFSKNVEFFSGYGLAATNSGNYDYWLIGFNLIGIFK